MSDPSAAGDPSLRAKLAAASASRPLPKRFYADAAMEAAGAGFRLTLDGKSARTPSRREIWVASQSLAKLIAAEWTAQGATIDPATMPLTTLVCTALDTVADQPLRVRDEIVAYAGSDLLCYRAEAPAGLVALQERHWDAPLAWGEAALGARFVIATGLMPVTQPPAAQSAVRDALEPLGALELAAVHVLTTLTGSAILALSGLRGALDLDAIWTAAHVDEDWQIAQWGEDAEAAARRTRRRREAEAAMLVLTHAR
jgi:chaperone required for assembly of F1-ATPase